MNGINIVIDAIKYHFKDEEELEAVLKLHADSWEYDLKSDRVFSGDDKDIKRSKDEKMARLRWPFWGMEVKDTGNMCTFQRPDPQKEEVIKTTFEILDKNIHSGCRADAFAHAIQLFRILTEKLDFDEPFQISIDYDPKRNVKIDYHFATEKRFYEAGFGL